MIKLPARRGRVVLRDDDADRQDEAAREEADRHREKWCSASRQGLQEAVSRPSPFGKGSWARSAGVLSTEEESTAPLPCLPRYRPGSYRPMTCFVTNSLGRVLRFPARGMAAAAPAGLKTTGRKSPLRRALGREYFGLRFHFHTPPIWRNACHLHDQVYTAVGAPNGRKKKEAPPPPPPKFVPPPPPPPKNEVVENALRKIREGRMLTEKEMAALEEEEAKMDSALDKLQEGKMLFQAEMDALEREMGRGVQQTWSKAPVGVYEGPKYTGGWGSSGREVADLRAKLQGGQAAHGGRDESARGL